MDVVLQYLDGCPHWIDARSLITEALETVGENTELVVRRIETPGDAVAAGFTGSPTILINDTDPFAVDRAEPGLAFRLYPTPDGPSRDTNAQPTDRRAHGSQGAALAERPTAIPSVSVCVQPQRVGRRRSAAPNRQAARGYT